MDTNAAVSVLLQSIQEEFLPDKILASLLSETENFFGEKELLFTAFCAWICSPNDLQAIRRAVVIRLFQMLDLLERRWAKKHPESDARVNYIAVRTIRKYAPLFGELYARLGGSYAIVNCHSPRQNSGNRSEQLRTAEHIYRLIGLMHFQVTHLVGAGPMAGEPSLGKAISAYLAVFPKSKGDSIMKRQLESHWSTFRPSLPFLYAGLAPADAPHAFSQVSRSKNLRGRSLQSMMAAICLGFPTYVSRKDLLIRLLARARYTQEVILAKCPALERSSAFEFPSQVGSEKIPIPILTEADAATVASKFRDRRYLNPQIAVS